MSRIFPYFAQAQTDSIVIDGVTYRVPLIDSGGRVYVNAKATGAGELISILKRTVSVSATRVTIVTPPGGKRVRLVHAEMSSSHTAISNFELYFGTGASAIITPTKVVAFAMLNTTGLPTSIHSWPDGGGPVGGVDEVLSMRTGVDVGTTGWFLVQYRTE